MPPPVQRKTMVARLLEPAGERSAQAVLMAREPTSARQRTNHVPAGAAAPRTQHASGRFVLRQDLSVCSREYDGRDFSRHRMPPDQDQSGWQVGRSPARELASHPRRSPEPGELTDGQSSRRGYSKVGCQETGRPLGPPVGGDLPTPPCNPPLRAVEVKPVESVKRPMWHAHRSATVVSSA
jgi:hypothetical protein